MGKTGYRPNDYGGIQWLISLRTCSDTTERAIAQPPRNATGILTFYLHQKGNSKPSQSHLCQRGMSQLVESPAVLYIHTLDRVRRFELASFISFYLVTMERMCEYCTSIVHNPSTVMYCLYSYILNTTMHTILYEYPSSLITKIKLKFIKYILDETYNTIPKPRMLAIAWNKWGLIFNRLNKRNFEINQTQHEC